MECLRANMVLSFRLFRVCEIVFGQARAVHFSVISIMDLSNNGQSVLQKPIMLFQSSLQTFHGRQRVVAMEIPHCSTCADCNSLNIEEYYALYCCHRQLVGFGLIKLFFFRIAKKLPILALSKQSPPLPILCRAP